MLDTLVIKPCNVFFAQQKNFNHWFSVSVFLNTLIMAENGRIVILSIHSRSGISWTGTSKIAIDFQEVLAILVILLIKMDRGRR